MAALMIKTKNDFFPITPNRLITVFQPHRFSRTKKFEKQFAKSLINSDLVFVTPIYSAGENPIEGVNNKILTTQIKRLKPNLEVYAPNNNHELIKLLINKTKPQDLILMMGAGNINLVLKNLFFKSTQNKPNTYDLAA